MSKAFIVKSKDLFDKKKNPTLSLSPKDILKNKRVPKIKLAKCPKCERAYYVEKIKNQVCPYCQNRVNLIVPIV